MKKEEKKQKAETLHQELEGAKTVFLSSFEGLTVAADSQLRRQVRESGANYQVVKNSLIERAAQGTQLEPAAKKLRGTTSLAYTAKDPVALAKILTTYARENPALVFKTGVVEGRVVSLADLMSLATLPSRDELFAKALYLIKAPAQQVAVAISGVARNLARVIQQGVKEEKFKSAS
jgi:large subunit ribosomal protein L10